MGPSGNIITQAAESKTLTVFPEIAKGEPRYMAADIYYVWFITHSQEGIFEEATDEEFFIASISSKAYESWLEEEDIIDHKKRRPL